MINLSQVLMLATEGAEGLSGDHIAAKLAVPVGMLIFCGGVYLLLWSNYGAKKGALIYSTAFFGFCCMLGIFWWFGAPGTPVATGVRNFPGQPADQYDAKWFPFEPGSDAAEMLPASNNLGDFTTVADFVGSDSGPMFANTEGDVAQATDLMTELVLREEGGQILLGGDARSEYLATAEDGLAEMVDDPDNWSRAEVAFTAEAGEGLLTRSNGTLVAGSEITVFVNYVNEAADSVEVPVATLPTFAFKQESLLWFPSAVWVGVTLVLFLLSLFGLDRLEMREKKREDEIDEPESLAVPIRQ